jgi:enamine deaminase RidA (YjgF/YER057c/UK114 family)
MATQHINPSNVGAPNMYTHVVASEGGKTLYISGQIGMDAAGKVAGPDLMSQGEQVFQNIKACLESAGATFADVVKFTTFVVNYKPEDRATITALRQKYIPSTNPPASTLVGVQALALPELLIEIETVAVVH